MDKGDLNNQPIPNITLLNQQAFNEKIELNLQRIKKEIEEIINECLKIKF